MFGVKTKPQGLIAVVENADQLTPILQSGYRFSRERGEKLRLLVVNESAQTPDWFEIPSRYEAEYLDVQIIDAASAEQDILQCIRKHPPILFGFCLTLSESGRHYKLSPVLESVLYRIKCPVAMLRVPSDWTLDEERADYLVPFFDDENSRFALNTILQLHPEAQITLATVSDTPIDSADRLAREQAFSEDLAPWTSDPRITTKFLFGEDPAALLLAEAAKHDMIVMGNRRGKALLGALLGGPGILAMDEVAHQLVDRSDKPAVILREYQGWLGSNLARFIATGNRLLPTLGRAEQVETYRQVRRAARPRLDFFTMIGSSAFIAALGLILNSPAVIIGAMLIAPLMSAIIGMGLAIVQGDLKFLGKSLSATFRGATLALLMGLIIGLFYLGDTATQEMLGRTRPTLLDLLVALVSGAAAAYALCRKDVSAALPGVAIAVALVPPLATSGLFLGMTHWLQAFGALLLFLTNLTAITFASCIVFALLGFSPPNVKGKDMARLQTFQKSFMATAVLVVLICTFLTFLTYEKIIEHSNDRIAGTVLKELFVAEGGDVDLIRWQVGGDDRKWLEVSAHVSTHLSIEPAQLDRLAEQLSEALAKPVKLTLTQVRALSTSTAGPGNAESQ